MSLKNIPLIVAMLLWLFTCSAAEEREKSQSFENKSGEFIEEIDRSVPFSKKDKGEKERHIVRNVQEYINSNVADLDFQNYNFLLENHNKLRPCPDKEHKIKVYLSEEINAESSVYLNQSYEFLNPDSKYGELDMYGISFSIDKNTGQVINHHSYCSFTRWSNGRKGERESLGGKFVSYEETNVPNIRTKYGNEKLISEADKFFREEMAETQRKNRHKCY